LTVAEEHKPPILQKFKQGFAFRALFLYVPNFLKIERQMKKQKESQA
jgi:hypothetical protein